MNQRKYCSGHAFHSGALIWMKWILFYSIRYANLNTINQVNSRPMFISDRSHLYVNPTLENSCAPVVKERTRALTMQDSITKSKTINYIFFMVFCWCCSIFIEERGKKIRFHLDSKSTLFKVLNNFRLYDRVCIVNAIMERYASPSHLGVGWRGQILPLENQLC